MSQEVAQGNTPASAIHALSLGKLVAFQKPSGAVCGLVVGDFLRRLVARTIAQHFAQTFDRACHPYQFALATRAGSEALVHSLQLATGADPTLIILSVDGIGAYDHVSRTTMLTALRQTAEANQALPFARMFCSTPSTYIWTDQPGQTHPVQQAEGGEQGTLSFALEAILAAQTEQATALAWKLWLLLPRMLLHRQPGTRTLSKEAWRSRISLFQSGDWMTLLQQSTLPDTSPAPSPASTQPDQQARRACQLVHQGELTAARQALTAQPLAPRNQSTLDELQDPRRRPASPYQARDPDILQFHPANRLQLPAATIIRNLRKTRKGAAPGPSGLTAETLRLVLDDEDCTRDFVLVASKLAAAEVPLPISQAIGLGRVVALQKSNGRVRGIIVGDLLRRVVSRSLAQFALSTRAGTETIVHAITAATEIQGDLTVLSVDGVGAYDTISRNSMLRGLHTVPSANQCLPFVRQFYTQPSHYVWHDDANQPHIITQAEGGEQGDPLMPALFALGQRAALADVQQQLHPGEHLFAFFDDVYALVPPDRVQPFYALLEHHLFQHAHVQLHRGKARVWNRAGLQPPRVQHLGPEAWVGWVLQRS